MTQYPFGMKRISKPILVSIMFMMLACAPTALFAEEGSAQLDAAGTTGTLEVRVNVTGANVYLDGGSVGTNSGSGPVTVDNVAAGLHRLTVMKDGYYAEAMTVRIIAGETTKVSVSLDAITGTIEISGMPAGTAFAVSIGDKEYDSKRIEIAEGEWVVSIRVFGYKEQTERVRVRRKENTAVAFKGEPAPFAASALSVSRRSFSPDNPELLGRAEIAFSVTAPGSGQVEIRDGSGATVRTIELAPFATWKQRAVWDGTTDSGAALPDGVYPFSVSVASADGQTALSLVSNATIDRSIEYPLAGTDAGVGSVGPVAIASLMPARSIRFDAGASAFDGAYGARMSVDAGITEWLEAGARFEALTDGDEESALDFAGGFKAGRRAGALRVAAALAWTGRSQDIGGSAGKDRNGLTLAAPVELSAGRFTVGVTPSIAFGDRLGFMDDPYFTAGIGATARARFGSAFLGLYGVADSVAFGGTGGASGTGSDDAVLGPIGAWSAGASASVVLPGTSALLSLEGGYAKSAGERGGAYASGGIGIAF